MSYDNSFILFYFWVGSILKCFQYNIEVKLLFQLIGCQIEVVKNYSVVLWAMSIGLTYISLYGALINGVDSQAKFMWSNL